MGWIRHHAMLVTGMEKPVTQAHERALACFAATRAQVSPVSSVAVNGYTSFCVFPDGSKEGWDESNEGQGARDAFAAYLASAGVDWCEAQYGDDDYDNRLTRASGGLAGDD